MTPAHGAEVGYPPGQACQVQHALDQAQTLTQCQTKEGFHAREKLDGRIREDLLATTLASGAGIPLHAPVQPKHQRPSCLEGCVVLGPVGGLVALCAGGSFTHGARAYLLTGELCTKPLTGYSVNFAPKEKHSLKFHRTF